MILSPFSWMAIKQGFRLRYLSRGNQLFMWWLERPQRVETSSAFSREILSMSENMMVREVARGKKYLQILMYKSVTWHDSSSQRILIPSWVAIFLIKYSSDVSPLQSCLTYSGASLFQTLHLVPLLELELARFLVLLRLYAPNALVVPSCELSLVQLILRHQLPHSCEMTLTPIPHVPKLVLAIRVYQAGRFEKLFNVVFPHIEGPCAMAEIVAPLSLVVKSNFFLFTLQAVVLDFALVYAPSVFPAFRKSALIARGLAPSMVIVVVKLPLVNDCHVIVVLNTVPLAFPIHKLPFEYLFPIDLLEFAHPRERGDADNGPVCFKAEDV